MGKFTQPVLLSRTLAYLFLFIFSFGEAVVSSAVLAYSVGVYRGGYIKSNPQLVAISSLSVLLMMIAFFVPYEVRRRMPLYGEMLLIAIFSVLWFASLIRLHIATPGLLFNCGGFTICKGWISMLVIAWMALGCTGWVIVTLLIGAFWGRNRTTDFHQSVWKCYAGEYFDPASNQRMTAMSFGDISTRLPRMSHFGHSRTESGVSRTDATPTSRQNNIYASEKNDFSKKEHDIDSRSQFTLE